MILRTLHIILVNVTEQKDIAVSESVPQSVDTEQLFAATGISIF
jgi:hypothetical protein